MREKGWNCIDFRTYNAEPRYGEDYNRLRSFLLELGDINYSFGRWDWMISHSYLDVEGLSKIGILLDNEAIVGIATYDTMLDGKCCTRGQGEITNPRRR